MSHWGLTLASLLVLSEPIAIAFTFFYLAFACLQAIVYTKVIPELEFTEKYHKYTREGLNWENIFHNILLRPDVS